MSLKLPKKVVFTALLFFIVAFLYRIYGLWNNHPFWVDEFSTANQARLTIQYGLGVFRDTRLNFEPHNALYHFLVGFFFTFLGESEFIARLPSAIIGAAVPTMVFLLAYSLFNTTVGFVAGSLTTLSYFEITWSRQARSYIFLQFFILTTLFLYFQITQNKKRSPLYIGIFTLSVICGLLFHSLFYIFLASLIVHFIITNLTSITKKLRNPKLYIGIAVIILIAFLSNFLTSLISYFFEGGLVRANNLWYYHSFLWREYGLVTFLAIVGFFLTAFSRKKFALLIGIFVLFHLYFISYLFEAYVSRYLLPLWPLILILMAVTIGELSNLFSKKTTLPTATIGALFIFGIVIHGHKFVIKPKSFYSVNHDFREIALVDYHKVYTIIKKDGDIQSGKTAVIDTWPDRAFWYVNRNYGFVYSFRWLDEKGRINGLAKKSNYNINDKGEKAFRLEPDLRLVGELSDLKRVMKEFPKGYIYIDDSTLPQDVREYAENNLTKQLYLDHYPLDDNPYSIWPATLYSWGIH